MSTVLIAALAMVAQGQCSYLPNEQSHSIYGSGIVVVTWSVSGTNCTLTPVYGDWEARTSVVAQYQRTATIDSGCDLLQNCSNDASWDYGTSSFSVSSGCSSSPLAGTAGGSADVGFCTASFTLSGDVKGNSSNASDWVETFLIGQGTSVGHVGYTVTPTSGTWSVHASVLVEYGYGGSETTWVACPGYPVPGLSYPVQVSSPSGLGFPIDFGLIGADSNGCIPIGGENRVGELSASYGSLTAGGILAEDSPSSDHDAPACTGTGPRYVTDTTYLGDGAYSTTLSATSPAYVRFYWNLNNPGNGAVYQGIPLEYSCDCGPCFTDYNNDGNSDSGDLAIVIACIAGEDVPIRCCDVNGDGNTDQDDVAELVNRLAGGGSCE